MSCCMHCPYALTDAAEMVQNYGCLPTPYDIVQMKRDTGHNWSCHENNTKLCAGYARHIKKYHPELDIKTGGLIEVDVWESEGLEAAVALIESDHK